VVKVNQASDWQINYQRFTQEQDLHLRKAVATS
jgi:hypothetical protein